MKPRYPLFIALTFLIAALSGRSWAQSIATAKTIFELAKKEMSAGNYMVACPAFAESQRLDPRPLTLLALAACYDRWGKIATAVASFDDFLREHAKMPPATKAQYDARARKAERRRLELLPQVPSLTLNLPLDAPEGVEVQRNGVEVSAASLGVPLPMDPGEYVVTTQVGNGPTFETRINLDRGVTRVVTLEVKLPKQAPPPPPPPEPMPARAPEPSPSPAAPAAAVAAEPSTATPTPKPAAKAGNRARDAVKPSAPPAATPAVDPYSPAARAPSITGRQIGALFTGGVGLAGLVLGTVSGVIVLQKKSIVQDHCNGLVCDAEGKAAADSASLPGALSTVGFGLGGVGVATGLLLWLTEPPAPATPAVGSGLRPAASVDRTGVVIGMKGAW